MGKDGDYRHVSDLKKIDSDQVITMRWAPLCKTHLVQFDQRRRPHLIRQDHLRLSSPDR